MARTINGIPMPEITQQDTIDDTALIPITNKDGRVRNISFATLKTGITKGGVSAQKNLDPSLPVGLIDIQNDNIDLATVASGKLTLDISKLPTNIPIASVKYVRDKSDLAGTLSSDTQYIIDGTVDMGSQSIEVPAGGLSIAGFGFNVSTLFSSTSNHIMFTSPLGGSGDLHLQDLTVKETGTGAKVYDLTDSNGQHGVEVRACNYDSCTSLGTLSGYRQGFETGTGRIFGTPELELDGTWSGGYRITSSIAVAMNSGFVGSLFKAGPSFVMNNRFLTDINATLPTACSFADFSPVHFPNPSTVQIQGAIFTRDGDVAETMPNLAASDLECAWRSNQGLGNTYVGGDTKISAQAVTTVSVIGTFYDVMGGYTADDLQHFDEPASGQLRHLGKNPIDFKVNLSYSVLGLAGDTLTLKIVKWDDLLGSFVDVASQSKAVNNLVGGDDIAFFSIIKSVQLRQNDFIKIQIANNSSTANITALNESYYEISER